MPFVCKCGHTMDPSWEEVVSTDGIGGRKIWTVLPSYEDDPSGNEDCEVMCPYCGRIYHGYDWGRGDIGWDQVDHVDPLDMKPITESRDFPDDAPLFFVAKPKPDTVHKMVYQLIEAHEMKWGVIALLYCVNLHNDMHGLSYCIAFFRKHEGIGGRTMLEWNRATLTDPLYESNLRPWIYDLINMEENAWAIFSLNDEIDLEPMDSMPEQSVMEADEACKKNNRGPYFCVCGESSFRWVDVQKVEGIGGREIWETLPDGFHGDAWRCICGRVYVWTRVNLLFKLMTVDESIDAS